MRTRKSLLLVLLCLLSVVRPAVAAMVGPEDVPEKPPAARQGAQTLAVGGLLCNVTTESESLSTDTSLESWRSWISQLSGSEPFIVNGQPVTITTRSSAAMFNGSSPAFYALSDRVRQLVKNGYGQVEEETYTFNYYTWKNLVLTIPGTTAPDEIVMMTAHFDDAPTSGPAPGADDNASGSATLLEAARLLSSHPLPRTVKIVWFTGEELGLRGSAAYVNAHSEELSRVKGVINLDMYAYDGDNDSCFELHVGMLNESNQVGQCIARAVQKHHPDLHFDYFTTGATGRSDHASFWGKGVGAVEIGENFSKTSTPGGCTLLDMSPFYHTSGDTIGTLNLDTGYAIHQSALAALFAMASLPPYNRYFPFVPYQVP